MNISPFKAFDKFSINDTLKTYLINYYYLHLKEQIDIQKNILP